MNFFLGDEALNLLFDIPHFLIVGIGVLLKTVSEFSQLLQFTENTIQLETLYFSVQFSYFSVGVVDELVSC